MPGQKASHTGSQHTSSRAKAKAQLPNTRLKTDSAFAGDAERRFMP